MKRLRSFPPVADERAVLLILGSMPGKTSLQRQQYYAHPHNAFWKLMGALVGAHPQLPYGQRLQVLRAARIALWDVLHSCEREGSLDRAIVQEKPNDFTRFFACHPHITHVCFNGSKAEQSFKRWVLGKQQLPKLHYLRLPSTSPAHAAMCYAEKLQSWRAAIQSCL